MNHYSTISGSKQTGFTLIEVLATVLIMAIGALGVASLQLAGLKYTSGSYARTQAVILADDMANRLKSNRAAALELDVDGDIGNDSPYLIPAFASESVVGMNCLTDECNGEQLAAYDLNTWLAEVARVLPSGQGLLTFVDAPNSVGVNQRQFNIGIQWRQVAGSSDQESDDDDELRNFAFRISL